MEDSVRDLMSEVIGSVVERLDQIRIANAQEKVDIPTADILRTSETDDEEEWTCAICLDVPAHVDRCTVVGCGHVYCVSCIVHWASTRPEAARCPTCKEPFSLISLNKHLDGSLSESPVKETVAMVARSSWFRAWLADREQYKGSPSCTSQHTGPSSTYALLQEEWAEDELYSYFEQEFDEDDVEDYYVGRSTGRRHAFGNRPFGPNGYVRAGRKLAAVPKRPNSKVPSGACGSGSSCSNSQSTHKGRTGRRAQRKAHRATSDQ